MDADTNRPESLARCNNKTVLGSNHDYVSFSPQTFVARIGCPDGSTVELSVGDGFESNKSTATFMILGRGKGGIPYSASHVSEQACALRLVEEVGAINKEARYALELVVLGVEPCTIIRSAHLNGPACPNSPYSFLVRSVSQLLAGDHKDLSPSVIRIKNGDVIEPYDKDEISKDGHTLNFPFKVSIIDTTSTDDGTDVSVSTITYKVSKAKISEAAAEDITAEMPNDVEVSPAMAIDSIDAVEPAKNGASLPAAANEIIATVVDATGALPSKSSEGKTVLFAAKPVPISRAKGLMPLTDHGVKMPDESNLSSTTFSISAHPSNDPPSNPKSPPTEQSSDEESSDDCDDIDNPREELLKILRKTESPGTFAVAGSCDNKLNMPGLVVNGMGTIGLPLCDVQAKDLVKRCKQATFGRESKATVDMTSRGIFQLEPDHFSINNPSWSKDLKELTTKVCQGLGVQGRLTVEARLHKLYLYQEGSFIESHRDSKKGEGIFGKLAIVLPSQFAGGELFVKHKGQTKTFDQAAGSRFGSQYVSFYTSCKHEQKKVKSGYRICLVYNLVKVGKGLCPTPTANRRILKRLKSLAKAWSTKFSRTKLVLLTEPSSIKNRYGRSSYKGSGAAIEHALKLAIENGADIEFDHGTVTRSTESEDRFGEVYYSMKLSIWGDVEIDVKEEMTPEDFFDGLDPVKKRIEELYGGGYNIIEEYAAEAIVVWPRSQRGIVATREGICKLCKHLVKACKEGSPHSEPREDLKRKIKDLIPLVALISPNYMGCGDRTMIHVAHLMWCIIKVDDEALALSFLDVYLASKKQAPPNAILNQLPAFVDCFGPGNIGPSLAKAFNSHYYSCEPSGAAKFLLKCCNSLQSKLSNTKLINDLIAAFVNSMRPVNGRNHSKFMRSIDQFPLKLILNLFLGENAVPNTGSLVKDLLESLLILWAPREDTLNGKSKQKYAFSTPKEVEKKGPVLLLGCNLAGICEICGWKEFEEILIDAVQKMCIHGSIESAVTLISEMAPENFSPTDTSDRLHVYTLIANEIRPYLFKAISSSNYFRNPSGTAKFLLKCCDSLRSVSSSKNFRDDLVAAFVDSTSASNEKSLLEKMPPIQNFPLKGILELFVGENAVANACSLVRRVLDEIIWKFCNGTIKKEKEVIQRLQLLVGCNLASICELCSWKEFEEVLIGAVQKMCIHGSVERALALTSEMAPEDSSPTDTSDRLHVYTLMANEIRPYLFKAISSCNYFRNPSGTANFLLKCCDSLRSNSFNNELANDLIAEFVNSMSVSNEKSRPEINWPVDKFPLQGILELFVGENGVANACSLVKRVLEGIVWVSCQKVVFLEERRAAYRGRLYGGPVHLVGCNLAIICEFFGWNEFEEILIDAINEMIKHGSAESAIALVKEITPEGVSQTDTSDRMRVCKLMASTVCKETMLSRSWKSLKTHQNLAGLIAQFSLPYASDFESSAKKCDIDDIFTLVTDEALRSSACNSMKNSLDSLACHCALQMVVRLSKRREPVDTWTIEKAKLYPCKHISFLESPCEQMHDEEVPYNGLWFEQKPHLDDLSSDLQPLIDLGEVSTELYKEYDTWHFSIIKKKSKLVDFKELKNLMCSCVDRYCLRQHYREVLQQCNKDRKKIGVLMNFLTPAQQSQISGGRKRSAEARITTGSIISNVQSKMGECNSEQVAKKQKSANPRSSTDYDHQME